MADFSEVFDDEFEIWMLQVRRMLKSDHLSEGLHWAWGATERFAGGEGGFPHRQVLLPTEFLRIARRVVESRAPGRWELLTRVLFRIRHEDPGLLRRFDDPDVLALHELEASVWGPPEIPPRLEEPSEPAWLN